MKKIRLQLLFIAMAANISLTNAQVSWLHVQGNQIKDASDNNVTLRGVSVMAPEHNNECGTCSSKPINEMITWQTDASRGWNSRIVRLQVTTSKVSDPAASFTTIIDPYVQQAIAKGLYVIVDLHFVSDYGPGGIPQSYVMNFWNYVAPRYANTPNVIFEVFNEPINPDNWTTWKNYIQPVVNSIRSVAPNNLVLVGGPQWSTRVNNAVNDPIAGNNIVYVYHIYPNQGAASTTNLDAKFGTAAQIIPVMVTEFGWNQNASYSNTVTRGTTSLWGQPFRDFIDARPHISWTGYIFDNYWMPQYFDVNWNLMSGDNQGQFMQQWFSDKKDQDQPQPASLIASAISTSQVNLSWPSTAGILSYNVKRSQTSGGPYTTIATGITTTTFSDLNLSIQTAYYYVVSANTTGGEGANSNQASATTDTLGYAPDIPMLPTATGGNAQVSLSWRVATGATGYNVKRSTTHGGPYTIVATGITTTSYVDLAVNNGTMYYYVVSATGSRESSNSAEVSEIPSSVVAIVDNTDAVLTGSWTTSSATPGYYGSNYFHDGNTGTAGGKSIRFSPNLTIAGTYDVAVRWTSNANRATNTPIDVNYAGGSSTYTESQQGNGGLWISLGSFNFSAGSAGNVLIRNDGTDGYVIADAVKFALVSGQLQNSTMHVQSIVASAVSTGQGKKRGQAVVTIVDSLGAPVPSATVSGSFSGTFNESVSGVTNTSGTVTFQTAATAKGTVTVDFCVNNVTHSSLTYDNIQNIITCTNPSSTRSTSDKNTSNEKEPALQILHVYPNPVTDMLTIDGLMKDMREIRIYDMLGRELMKINPAGQSRISVDIQKLKPGTYLLLAEGGKTMRTLFIKNPSLVK